SRRLSSTAIDACPWDNSRILVPETGSTNLCSVRLTISVDWQFRHRGSDRRVGRHCRRNRASASDCAMAAWPKHLWILSFGSVRLQIFFSISSIEGTTSPATTLRQYRHQDPVCSVVSNVPSFKTYLQFM